MRVAVDVGYGFTKVLAETGERAVFASTMMRRDGEGGLSAVGSAQEGHTVDVLRPGRDAEGWRVGAAAGARSWQTDAATRDGYDVLLLAGAALAGAEGDVDVQAGLPLTLYLQKGQRRALRDRITGLEAWIGIDGRDARRIHVVSVQVWPQGAGAAIHAILGDPSLADKPLGLVDVGYRTTDYLVMRRSGGSLAPDEALAGSVDLGIGMAYEAARARIEREHGVLVPEGEIERAETEYRGRMWVRGEELDAAGIVRQEAKAIGARIVSEIHRQWGGGLDLLGAVLLAGGGAVAMRDPLGDLAPTVRLVTDPLWANASGYLALSRRAAGHPSETPVR